jgi:hypothetical protein
MTTILEDLLVDGVVIPEPGNEARVIFNVPLLIPKDVINSGGLSLFAKAYGWTETVKVEDVDTPNPVKDYEHGIEVIRKFAWEVLEAQLITQAQKQAADTVKAQIELLKAE